MLAEGVKMKRSLYLFLVTIIFSSASGFAETKNISIGLDWFINPDHAPIIIANEKNYFKEKNINIEIIEPADPNDPPKLVAAGKIDIAISYQPQFHLVEPIFPHALQIILVHFQSRPFRKSLLLEY